MMKQIRIRFIRIALLALSLAMLLVADAINAVHIVSTVNEQYETLQYLTENQNNFSKKKQGGTFGGENQKKEFSATEDSFQQGGKNNHNHHMQAALEESRYFMAIQNTDGELLLGDGSKETDYTEEELLAIAGRVFASGDESGMIENYLYRVTERDDGFKTAVFLNCESKRNEIIWLALISLLACAIGILLALILVSLLSKKAIQPMMENIERQKQFITDAGHELKTPLTVISANMDVLSMDIGQNEWVQGTQKQVANMRKLVNELVYLSRMDETDSHLEKSIVDLSKAVQDVAAPFEGMADFNGKVLNLHIVENITVNGDEAALRRLVSILCENAVKYAPEDSEILISLTQSGKSVVLITENVMKEPLSEEALNHLFDRFYRADESRSKEENSGFGIGLSIARAITEKHGGTIKAKIVDSNMLQIICLLPKR